MGNSQFESQSSQPQSWEDIVMNHYLFYKQLFDRGNFGPLGPRGPGDRENYEYWKGEYNKIQEKKVLLARKKELERTLLMKQLREEIYHLEQKMGAEP